MTNITHIQFHIGDFLSGVMHMDGAEIGAYTMMIMAHYQAGTCGLPDDNKKLMQITRTNPKIWKRIKDTVLEKFYLEDGYWKHTRVIDELEKIHAKAGPGRGKKKDESQDGNPKDDFGKSFSDSQVENKSLKNKDSEKTNHNPITNNHIEDTNVSSPPISPKNRFEEFWELFPRQRRGNKQKAEQAYSRALKENRASEEEIIDGVQGYRISDEVQRGYAKGAAAWLNDDRWGNDYDCQAKPARGADQGQKSSYFDTLRAASRKAQTSRMGEDGGRPDAAGVGTTGTDGAGTGTGRIPLPPSACRYDPASPDPAGDAQASEGGRKPEGLSAGRLHRTAEGGD